MHFLSLSEVCEKYEDLKHIFTVEKPACGASFMSSRVALPLHESVCTHVSMGKGRERKRKREGQTKPLLT